MDDLQRLVWEAYGRKLPTKEAGRLIEEKRAEARRKLEQLQQPLPEDFRFNRDEANDR